MKIRYVDLGGTVLWKNLSASHRTKQNQSYQVDLLTEKTNQSLEKGDINDTTDTPFKITAEITKIDQFGNVLMKFHVINKNQSGLLAINKN